MLVALNCCLIFSTDHVCCFTTLLVSLTTLLELLDTLLRVILAIKQAIDGHLLVVVLDVVLSLDVGKLREQADLLALGPFEQKLSLLSRQLLQIDDIAHVQLDKLP